jgi:hypothetical protein
MTLGRAVTFTAIFVVSVVSSVVLVRRDRSRHPAILLSTGRPFSGVVATAPLPRRVPPAATLPSVAPPEPSASSTEPAEDLEDPMTEALCPADMVLVDATTCAERDRPCAERDASTPRRCLRYTDARCKPGLALRFCIDRYEFPDDPGALPAVMVTYESAKEACDEEGKRLCRELEWTLSCEGPEGFALPYGNAADLAACNGGHPQKPPKPEELWEPVNVSRIVTDLDGRVRSGTLDRCVSTFGAYDLTGNVAEWVVGADSGPALMGGKYSSADPTCRAIETTHQSGFRSLDTGFRCCRDPLVRVPARGRVVSRAPARTVAPKGGFD